jgi:hypothetical protein
MTIRFDGTVAVFPDGTVCQKCGGNKKLLYAKPEEDSLLPNDMCFVICSSCLKAILEKRK